MRVIKEKDLHVKNQILELDSKIYLLIREKEAEAIFKKFDSIYGIKIKEIE